MKRLKVILDSEPDVIHLWNSWEARRGRIEKNVLAVEFPHGTLTVEAADPQLIADVLLSHDPGSDIVKGRLGIERVEFEEKEKREPGEALVKALRELLDN